MVNGNDEVGYIPSFLNFSYNFFVGKYVAHIMLHTHIDDTNLSISEEMINVAPLSGQVRIYILQALICEAMTLQQIITISYAMITMCEGIIKMLTPHTAGDSTSQPLILGDDNTIILSDQSREVSKYYYDDLFISKNEEYDDGFIEQFYDNDSCTALL